MCSDQNNGSFIPWKDQLAAVRALASNELVAEHEVSCFVIRLEE